MKLATLALSVAAGLALSSAANAQVMGITGLFAEAGLGVRATSSEVTDAFGPGTVTTDVGERGLLGSLRAGWRSAMMPNADFGISLFWNPADEDTGRTTSPVGALKVRQHEHWGLGAEAGWKLAQPTTVYARLEWHRAEFKLETSTPGLAADSSKRLNGWGYGFGIRHVMQQNTYVFAEWQQIEFEDGAFTTVGGRGEIEPRSTFGLVGVGMQF